MSWSPRLLLICCRPSNKSWREMLCWVRTSCDYFLATVFLWPSWLKKENEDKSWYRTQSSHLLRSPHIAQKPRMKPVNYVLKRIISIMLEFNTMSSNSPVPMSLYEFVYDYYSTRYGLKSITERVRFIYLAPTLFTKYYFLLSFTSSFPTWRLLTVS